jgi:hypothetical protein
MCRQRNAEPALYVSQSSSHWRSRSRAGWLTGWLVGEAGRRAGRHAHRPPASGGGGRRGHGRVRAPAPRAWRPAWWRCPRSRAQRVRTAGGCRTGRAAARAASEGRKGGRDGERTRLAVGAVLHPHPHLVLAVGGDDHTANRRSLRRHVAACARARTSVRSAGPSPRLSQGPRTRAARRTRRTRRWAGPPRTARSVSTTFAAALRRAQCPAPSAQRPARARALSPAPLPSIAPSSAGSRPK